MRGYWPLMVQKPPASCKEYGRRQDEGPIQAGDSSDWNRVEFQPEGTEGIRRCDPGRWTVAVTFLKVDSPQRESGFRLAVMHTSGTAKGGE